MNIEDKQQSILTFRVGPVLCCAPSLPVLSIITPPKLTHIAGSDASMPGIFKHGPHIVKVIDLRIKFGIEQSAQTQPGNLIITILNDESFAFWVDQILDVFDFPSEGWGNLPAAIPRGVFTRTLLLNKKIHLYSEFEKLATINDLGYLKHYIKLLTQQTTNQPANQSVDTNLDHSQKKITTATSTLSEKELTLKPATQVELNEQKINNPTPVVRDMHVAKESPRRASIKPYSTTSTISNVTTAKIKNHTEVKKNTIQSQVTKKYPETKKILTPATEKTTLSSTEQVRASKIELNKTPTYQVGTYINDSNSKEVKPISNKSVYSDIDDETDISITSTILILIIILTAFVAGIYYLFTDDDVNNSSYKKEYLVSKTELNFEAKINQPTIENSTPESVTPITPITPITPVTPAAEKTPTIPEPAIKHGTETNLFNVENKTKENTDYRADISQSDNEITITIHQPVSEEKPSQKIVTVTPEKIEDDVKDENAQIIPPVTTLKKDELKDVVSTTKVINEVIHTVVKGDTLWAIAKKYVNDPFLYPELARLSKIKNPHRIYPGNRVRIRFIKK